MSYKCALAAAVFVFVGCSGEMSFTSTEPDYGITPDSHTTTPEKDEPNAPLLPPADKPAWSVCAEQTGEAKLKGGGVDIIWFIDTSGSMSEETQWVQQNINDFAQFIAGQNLDYRVVLVAEEFEQPPLPIIPPDGICVPPPLGGPDCTDGPLFRHIKEKVASTNGLIKLIETYPQYKDFLRPDSTKNFVAVSDDNSSEPASWFDDELSKLDGFEGYLFHSIVSYGPDPEDGCHTGAAYGKVYEELSKQTGGSMFQVCLTDWKPIFDTLAQSVAQSAKPPCSYDLPTPPDGQTIKPNQIQVRYLVNNQSIPIPRVDNEQACGGNKSFYYDDNDAPTAVVFCPSTCASMQGGKIHITYGCLEIG